MSSSATSLIIPRPTVVSGSGIAAATLPAAGRHPVPDVRSSMTGVLINPPGGGAAVTCHVFTPEGSEPNRVTTILMVTGGQGGGHRSPVDAIVERMIAPGSTVQVIYADRMPTCTFNRGLLDHLRYTSSNNRMLAKLANRWRQHVSARAEFRAAADQTTAILHEFPGLSYVFTNHRFLGDVLSKTLPANLPLAIGLADPGKVHQGWFNPRLKQPGNADKLLATNSLTKQHAIKHGVPSESIEIAGYPIRLAFQQVARMYSKSDIRKELQIPEDKTRILMMTAGNARNPGAFVSQMEGLMTHEEASSLYVIALTGNNQDMQTRIEEFDKRLKENNANGPRIKAVPTQDANGMAMYMWAANIMAIQPGGGSIGECIAMNVRPIVWGEKSGIEHSNRRFLTLKDLGTVAFGSLQRIGISSPRKFREAVYTADVTDDQGPYAPSHSNALPVEGAAERIAQFLQGQAERHSGRRPAGSAEPIQPTPRDIPMNLA
ncbi:UDP-N-acetylglucosamine:LPS N-acetylglucosamine transferase [Roseateles sp. YR242]|uniref:hypothetical protein n=1 Tax=Roseateles sp. YR242 TaxID=1855305 RepID=UPI0008D4CB1B|nr:hypothetical protein [Roseateles sp. YR242]SEK63434.1 UDP-N-acetylglucosamine:LPS N-acetylglucosamine transferase [Roseateles sp. YR242]